jgi:SPP1 family predicted phage head-tail adaptor
MAARVHDPGRLNARLRLETRRMTADGQGGVSEGWTLPSPSCGAGSSRFAPRPREEAGAAIAPVSHRVTIRHREDVRHDMRFVFRGRFLMVRAVRDPDESRRYLICDCEEGAP